MEYKIIVSYQDGKTIQKEVKDKQAEPLFGLKIGEEFNGETIGLSGHVLKITGGSDKDGFPMIEFGKVARKPSVQTGITVKFGARMRRRDRELRVIGID